MVVCGMDHVGGVASHMQYSDLHVVYLHDVPPVHRDHTIFPSVYQPFSVTGILHTTNILNYLQAQNREPELHLAYMQYSLNISRGKFFEVEQCC